MKKFIVVLLILTVLSLLSTSAFIYFSTKSVVDSMINSVRPLVNIKYQRFSNPMDGSISIHGVTVGDGYGTNIDVGSIELKLDSVFDYINLDKKLNSGEILPKLQLQINHVYVDLDLLASIEPEVIEQPSFEDTIDRIFFYATALGCGDIKEIGLNNLNELGYLGLDTSLNLNFEYNKLSSEVKMEAGVIMHGMGSYTLRTSMPNIYSAGDLVNPNNKISNLELEIQDLGYNESIIEYCVAQSGLERSVYLEQHMQALKAYLNDANINLSQEVYDSYQAYFVNKDTLTFNSQPESAINLQYINLYETKDWANILGLTVSVNGEKVDNIVFDWDKDTAIENLMNARAGFQATESKSSVLSQRNETLKKQGRYVEIPVTELDNYIHSSIKLETKLGKIYKGFVKGVTRSQVIVVIRFKGGKAEIPVGTNKISRVFVYTPDQ